MLPGAQLSPPSPLHSSSVSQRGAQAHDRGVGTHTSGRESLFDDCFCLAKFSGYVYTCHLFAHSSGVGRWVLVERSDSPATGVWSAMWFDLLVDGSAVGRMIGSTGLIASFFKSVL